MFCNVQKEKSFEYGLTLSGRAIIFIPFPCYTLHHINRATSNVPNAMFKEGKSIEKGLTYLGVPLSSFPLLVIHYIYNSTTSNVPNSFKFCNVEKGKKVLNKV